MLEFVFWVSWLNSLENYILMKIFDIGARQNGVYITVKKPTVFFLYALRPYLSVFHFFHDVIDILSSHVIH